MFEKIDANHLSFSDLFSQFHESRKFFKKANFDRFSLLEKLVPYYRQDAYKGLSINIFSFFI